MYVLKQVMNYGTARSATPSQPEDSTTETDNGKQSDPPSPQGVPSRLEREGVDVHKSDGRNAISQEESRAAHTTPDGTSLPTTSTQLVLASQASSLLHQFPVDNALLTSNSSTTLLPTSIAQLISAVSIAARISLKASALFLEAILESAQCTTDTSMGITRRALILAVQSARRLQMANLLGSSDGQHRSQDNSDSSQRRSSIEDSYLRVLDKYTNAGVYLIHNAFSLAELFTMSGFYLTRTIVSGGLSAAEESVRLFDDLFGNTEASRALASIISLVRRELTQDIHFTPSQSRFGHLATLASLTKALTAFACLQNATHRRSLASFKLKVIYDCTVVNRSRSESQRLVHDTEGRDDAEAGEADDLYSDNSEPHGATSHNGLLDARHDELDPITDVRHARDVGRTWRDEIDSSHGTPYLKRSRSSRSLASRAGPSAPASSSEEELAYRLEQIVGDDADEQGRGIQGMSQDGVDPQLLQQIHEALAKVQQDMQNGETYDIEIETRSTTETTTVTAAVTPLRTEFSPRPSSIQEWEEVVPEQGTLAEQAMLDTETHPEQGKKQLGVIVRTLTKKMVERRQSIRKIVKAAPSSSSGRRKSDQSVSPTVMSRQSSSSGTSTPKQILSRFLKPSRKRMSTAASATNESTSAPTQYQTAVSSPQVESINEHQMTLDVDERDLTELQLPSPPRSSHNRMTSTTSVRTLDTSHTEAYSETYPDQEHHVHSATFPKLHLVENLQRFCKFSSAAYGQHFLRILGLGNIDYNFPNTGSHHGNVHAFAHHCGLRVEDVLLSSFTPQRSSPLNNSKAPPIVHYIAVDHHAKSIVLTLRGTLGLGDLLVDLTADYEQVVVEGGEEMASYYAHSGMLNAAKQLKAERGIVHDTLKVALQDYPDYGLVVTGHSLGGGVAALLSMLWACPSDQYLPTEGSRFMHCTPDCAFVTNRSSGLPAGRPLHCFAYGVPCVASPDLAEWSKGLITSIVHHLDVVATLSLGTLRDLKQVAAALWEDDGKIAEEVVGRVIGLYHRRVKTRNIEDTANKEEVAALMDAELDGGTMTTRQLIAGRKNHVEEVDYEDPALKGRAASDDAELDDWLWSLLKTLRATADTDKLYPPGHVYVIESHEVFVYEQANESTRGSNRTRREGRRVILRYSEDVAVRFSEPIFSRSMFMDHSPSAYESSINSLAQAILPC